MNVKHMVGIIYIDDDKEIQRIDVNHHSIVITYIDEDYAYFSTNCDIEEIKVENRKEPQEYSVKLIGRKFKFDFYFARPLLFPTRMVVTGDNIAESIMEAFNNETSQRTPYSIIKFDR